MTPVTKLVIRKSDALASINGSFRLKFTQADRYKLYSDAAQTQLVVSEQTEFPPNVETTLYFKGEKESLFRGGEAIELQSKIGNQWQSSETVKLTVVQAEFDFQIKFWIRENWVDVPWHPINNPLNNRIAGGDDRDASTLPTASYRVTQQVTVIPFRDLDADGIADGSDRNVPGTSSFYTKATSVPRPNEPYSDSNKLLPGARPAVTGAPDTSEMMITPQNRLTDNKATIRFHGAVNDPLVWLSANINWDITLTVDSTDPLTPSFSVTGRHDNYPAIEIDMTDSDGPRDHAYKWLHPLPSNLWDLVDGAEIDVPPETQGELP